MKTPLLLLLITVLQPVFGQSCPYNNALAKNGTCVQCAVLEFPNDTNCVPYSSRSAKMAADRAAPVDSGNTAWMLTASALVMVMTPALGMFYAGLVGENNVLNTMLMSIVSIAIVTVSWVLFGYSFAFGPGNGRFGMGEWAALNEVGMTPSAVYGINIPHVIFIAFQCMFAQIKRLP
jgi:Amt family ammonium transporter